MILLCGYRILLENKKIVKIVAVCETAIISDIFFSLAVTLDYSAAVYLCEVILYRAFDVFVYTCQ